jgi:hypothetical protein
MNFSGAANAAPLFLATLHSCLSLSPPVGDFGDFGRFNNLS